MGERDWPKYDPKKVAWTSATIGSIHDLRDHIIAPTGASGVTHPVAVVDAVATSSVIYYVHTDRLGRPILIPRCSRKSMARRWTAPRGATAHPNALTQSRCRL
jgi:hypothetical protein